ncbi:hypothetical protein [Rubinisphaera margarita]|uniref:hypothetical protein n=1 Tax=Rubinisphaera margarita TaxID=2909586 RepID=UPI001EE98AE7|nr:hypothetical protein [Rubinisphaera margarita]MCG6156144.1 hypothetical protein [Rubinisphaera margarita]
MPRIRFLILGLLLVSGAVIAAELALRHNYEDACVQLGLNGGDAGWIPCETGFLQAPLDCTVRYPVQPGTAIDLRYDSQGFRVTAEDVDGNGQRTVCLGSRRVLAPDLPVERTFAGRWESTMAVSPSPPVVLNGGMPRGCPLLWQLQFDSRIAQASADRLICVVGIESCENDFVVRRSMEFDASGRPQLGCHPGQSGTPGTDSTRKLIDQYRLIQVGLPLLGNLFFGREPASDPFESGVQLATEVPVTSELIRQALEPLADLSRRSAASGMKMTIVYLPTANEIARRTGRSQLERDSLAENCRRITEEFVAEQQLEFLDLTDHLLDKGAQGPLFREDGRRLTAAGHQLVAEVLNEAFTPRLASRPDANVVQ